MSTPILQPELVALPLWAQVLLASRLVQRAALAMLPDTPTSARPRLLAACDAIERCASRGGDLRRERGPLRGARDWQPTVMFHSLSIALQQVVAAAEAAEAAYDISSAEPAFHRAIENSMSAILRAGVFDERVARQALNEDVHALNRLCSEFGVGRYDPIPSGFLPSLPVTSSLAMRASARH